jgi:hypothetical protein
MVRSVSLLIRSSGGKGVDIPESERTSLARKSESCSSRSMDSWIRSSGWVVTQNRLKLEYWFFIQFSEVRKGYVVLVIRHRPSPSLVGIEPGATTVLNHSIIL